MTPTPIAGRLAALLVAVASLCASGAEAKDFASARAAARAEYWQQRQAAIDAQVANAASLRAVKLVFVGDSITDFWLLGGDPWIPGRLHGRRVWDESFGGAVPQNFALNIGISGDRTEHLVFRILPKSQGGLGQLDAAALAPEFFVLMVGINNSYAPEAPVADSVFEGVLAVMRSLHARKPGARLVLQSILPTAEPARDDTVESANACSQLHAGIGCADKYDVERRFREPRLCQVAPISTNPILSHGAEHVLGMPRSV